MTERDDNRDNPLRAESDEKILQIIRTGYMSDGSSTRECRYNDAWRVAIERNLASMEDTVTAPKPHLEN